MVPPLQAKRQRVSYLVIRTGFPKVAADPSQRIVGQSYVSVRREVLQCRLQLSWFVLVQRQANDRGESLIFVVHVIQEALSRKCH